MSFESLTYTYYIRQSAVDHVRFIKCLTSVTERRSRRGLKAFRIDSLNREVIGISCIENEALILRDYNVYSYLFYV